MSFLASFNEGKVFFSPQSLTRRNKHMKRVKGQGKEPLGTSLQLGIPDSVLLRGFRQAFQ